jgi:hypothetical protein
MLSYFLTLLRTVVELPSDASPIKEELMEDEAQKVGEESPAEDEDSESSSDEDVEIEGEDVDGEGEGTLGVYGTMANGNHAGGGIAGTSRGSLLLSLHGTYSENANGRLTDYKSYILVGLICPDSILLH